MTSIKSSFAVVFALALALTGAAAQAEYRCNPPKNFVDQRACELARQGPQPLRHFIERTKSIYHLAFYDYVTEADFDRWEAEADAEAARLVRSQAAATADRRNPSR